MAEEKADEYDGPMLEQRIEWKCPDRKRHNVVLFGSWNRFKGGDELEYQGKQIFATTVSLPLGNYVYRFLIDGEEWETNNGTGKTVRDGIEYNTIHVRDDDDESDSDSDDDYTTNTSNNNNSGNNNNSNNGGTLKAPNNGLSKQQTSSRVIFDERSGGFVVGQAPVGKKRRGRASMELDLGRNFDDEEVVEDENETTEGAPDDAKNNENGTNAPKKKKRRRRRRGDKNGLPSKDIQQEKEWARYVFVQQLRQQQQHNDEINRVKTLWKQERQVRVEMHKKVVKNFKQSKKDNQQLQLEITSLKKQLDVRAGGDKKRVQELELLNTQLEEERTKLKQNYRVLEDELNETKKLNRQKLQATQATAQDFGLERKKYETEIETLKTEINSLKARNESLQSNIETIKSGNTKTMDYQQKQFEEREQQLEQERKERDQLKEQIKVLRKAKKDLTDANEQLTDQAKADKKTVEQLTKKNKKLTNKVSGLEQNIEEIKTNTDEADRFKKQIETLTTDKNNEIARLAGKNKNLEQRINDIKTDYESQIEGIKKKANEDMTALTSKNNNEQTEHINKLKAELNNKDDLIKTLKDNQTALEEKVNEQSNACDTSNQKNIELKENLDTITSERDVIKGELDTLKSQFDTVTEELKTNRENTESSTRDLNGQIDGLKEDVNKLKQQLTEQETSFEEKTRDYDTQIDTLKNNLNDKGSETLEMSKQITDVKQQLDETQNNLKSANDRIDSLNNQLKNEQDSNIEIISGLKTTNNELTNKVNEIEEKSQNDKRQLEDALDAKTNELKKKLEEFTNAEVTINELNDKIDYNNKKFELERKDFEDQLKIANSKGDKIAKACKGILGKFSDLKKNMKLIKNEQIEQLEELQGFFSDFDDLLPKVFKFNQNMIDDLLNKYKRELSLRRKYFNLVQDLRGNIRVFCRVRPLLPFELKKNATSCLKFPQEGQLIITDDKNVSHSFEFDHVYKPGTTQENVSEDSTEYIQSVMDGYNVSIFAYGQTGSGKTYTMDGSKQDPGVNLRGLKHLFKLAQERKPQFQYKIKVAIFEIYNKKIRDLLGKVVAKANKKKKKGPKAAVNELKARHLPDGTVDIPGLSWKTVKSDKDVQDLADAAKNERSAGVTDMNAHSSRSHMLLVVEVSGVNIPANITYQGKLYLVDLAGSERVKKSGATGQSLKEAQNINASLSALGNVISALQRKEKFIPYRDSTLTSVMANAIGGNAKTIMFLNCCPTASHAFETLSSLKFGLRVAKVELGQASQNKKKKKKKPQ